ncbi:uncharacterized protein MONOS_15149 [Monocercomonoides exilis]|uniref:uncharacterized protein n=1 Tax=Monocercomonoides exilis TaxID=2049356 RepID=UPI00355A3B16|nr:hypothetical protein MONOS_15149 [Monocercomonoides exilis]|eukprot:MONOS_15149.1-p1 / transcript=MONOS_15149.1 / gene=MONOS_15149 / organism=Monocercomonoides_exilis_PA203 / gene_product=unspecified product / transcript_product=unspecified product / location=Mono_scaffold01155:13497-15644(-) / protein_length=715 / sequence_SO=supercontig / SO=protein_coding / is_pseudo=false
MGSRKESATSIERDQETCGESGNPGQSSSYCRKKKCGGRCPVKTRAVGRLRNQKSGSSDGTQLPQDQTDSRCVCQCKEQKASTVVRARQQIMSGRSKLSVEGRGGSCPSANSTDPSDDEESVEGESEDDSSDTGLDESDLEPDPSTVEKTIHEMEMFTNDITTRAGFEGERSSASSGRLPGNKLSLVKKAGEQWFEQGLRKLNVPDSMIIHIKNSVATSTWTTYTFGFAHFANAWIKGNMGELPSDPVIWVRKCLDTFICLDNEGFPPQCLKQTRSAVSLFTRSAFSFDLGTVPIIKTFFRSIMRKEKKRAPYEEIWDPQVLFNYLRTLWPNETLSVYSLTLKSITLCMLFTACRFSELASISMNDSIISENAIHLSVQLKTRLARSFITVPKLKEIQSDVCPVRAVLELWNQIKVLYPGRDTFIINTRTGSRMSKDGIRKLAKEAMKQAGINPSFRPYTIKHAALSALLAAGVPEVMVAHFARLSPTAHTPTNSYFKTNTAQAMAQVLTEHQPFPQTGSQIQPWSAQITQGSSFANIQAPIQSAINVFPVQHDMVLSPQPHPSQLHQQQPQTFNFQPSSQYFQSLQPSNSIGLSLAQPQTFNSPQLSLQANCSIPTQQLPSLTEQSIDMDIEESQSSQTIGEEKDINKENEEVKEVEDKLHNKENICIDQEEDSKRSCSHSTVKKSRNICTRTERVVTRAYAILMEQETQNMPN